MITIEQKKRIEELNKIIQDCKAEINSINPYYSLKEMSNKEFGEKWSENQIIKNCSSFEKVDSKGYDLFCKKLGRVEVKSSRLPCSQITFNQCHPKDCDYFLFVLYNTQEMSEDIFLVPSIDFMDDSIFTKTSQHDRGAGNCFSMNADSIKNKNSLEKYRIENFSELERFINV